MWLLVIFLVLALASQPYFKSRAALKESQRQSLKVTWESARNKRKLWKEEYPWLNFDHPDYQELWQIEIGAEDVYLLSINGAKPSTSWSEYNLEQAEAEDED